MSATTETWLTTGEVAEQLRLSKRTVQYLVGDGAFPGSKDLGGRAGYRIPQSAVEQFIRAAKDVPAVKGEAS